MVFLLILLFLDALVLLHFFVLVNPSNCCIFTVLNFGKSSFIFLFFFCLIVFLCHLSSVRLAASSSISLFFSPFLRVSALSIRWRIQSILLEGLHRCLLFDEIPAAEFGFDKFSSSSSGIPLSPYYYYYFESFSHQRLLIVSHWRLSDSKSPQVAKTLCILADLIYAVIWRVFTCLLIFKSSGSFTNSLGVIPSAQKTIIIIIIILFIWECFTPTLADGFPLDSEWQQVCSSLHDSS